MWDRGPPRGSKVRAEVLRRTRHTLYFFHMGEAASGAGSASDQASPGENLLPVLNEQSIRPKWFPSLMERDGFSQWRTWKEGKNMNDTTKKQKEFERLLNAYLKDGEIPEDVNVGQIISELRLREEKKVECSMIEIDCEASNFLNLLKTVEADFNAASFKNFWEGTMYGPDLSLRAAMRRSLGDLFTELKRIDGIIVFTK